MQVDARAPTPFTENGQPVSLEVVLFKPLEGGRFPTLVMNHGSTGDGSDPTRFGITFTSKTIARYFVERGWMVAFPQRRGCGQSDGLYDEGFKPDRSSYSCQDDLTLGGAERALDDLDAATDWIRSRADVDSTAGGLGAFHEFTRAPGLNGHFLINDPQLWALTMDDYLGQL